LMTAANKARHHVEPHPPETNEADLHRFLSTIERSAALQSL